MIVNITFAFLTVFLVAAIVDHDRSLVPSLTLQDCDWRARLCSYTYRESTVLAPGGIPGRLPVACPQSYSADTQCAKEGFRIGYRIIQLASSDRCVPNKRDAASNGFAEVFVFFSSEQGKRALQRKNTSRETGLIVFLPISFLFTQQKRWT